VNTYETIYAVVATIPSGKVASYGQVAKAAGFFRGAQMVGWALRALPADTTLPWQRVVAKDGRITIINPKVTKAEQVRRLEDEGITVVQQNGWYSIDDTASWHVFPEAN
jgi:methylated-DNA-protein-cysteine methyltransferase-like protein